VRGRFITFEGIDGSGKSTLLQALAESLPALGIAAIQTREPGGTGLGESLRTLMLNRPMSPLTETLLMFAARIEHVDETILPALSRGNWVLCDRFTDATYAYQCAGRGIPAEWVASLENWVHPTLQPDLTVLVDLDPQAAERRRAAQRRHDRFESEQLAFFERVRLMYLQRANELAHRYLILDGHRAVADNLRVVQERLVSWRA
jgi:dTMP kinase